VKAWAEVYLREAEENLRAIKIVLGLSQGGSPKAIR
jgi:hypothetical protein